MQRRWKGKSTSYWDEEEGEQESLLGKHTKKANCPKGQDAKSLA
jgi:hypothetical protein